MIEEYRYLSQHERINGCIEYSGCLFIHREKNFMYYNTLMFIYSKKELIFYYIIDNLLEIFYFYDYMDNWYICRYSYIILDDNSFLNKKKYGMLHKNVVINLI